LDGTLSFFEQETFTFKRILPNHLLPGHINYCHTTDSFIVATASKTIECYRYQIIAIAKESENPGANETSRGKKVVADWNIVLGETVMDIQIVAQDKRSCFIIVLGERNLFVATEAGSPVLVKKFDFSPVSMFSYMNGETLMTLIVTEFSTLLCFAHHSLKWASQMSFTAISVKLAQISGVSGVIVALSDSGDLSCCYLGTNPSLNLVSVAAEHVTIDHEKADAELQALRKVIRDFHEDANAVVSGTSRQSKISSVLQVEIQEANSSDLVNGDMNMMHLDSGIPFRIRLTSEVALQKVRVTIDLPPSLRSDHRTFISEKLVPNTPLTVLTNVHGGRNVLPANMIMTVTVVYFTEHEAPRVMFKHHQMPLKLVTKQLPVSEVRDDHSLSIGLLSNTSPKLNEFFDDIGNTAEDNLNEIGVSIGKSDASISLQMRGAQCKIIIKSGSAPCLAFVADELIRRMKQLGIRIDAASLDKDMIPIPVYMDLIDKHLSLRHQLMKLQDRLCEQAAQFRVIEKRFLVKLKDRNPAPMEDIDNLIIFISSKV
jgi:Bardet-Biedl syndrome 9 protein